MAAGFEQAKSAFRDHAAAELKVAPKKVQVGPEHESVADNMKISTESGQIPAKVGRAWAFDATVADKPGERRRGWATPDGRVATIKQDLGVLLEEGGIWTDAPSLTARDLAQRLTWSMGMGYQLINGFRELHVPATLEKSPDGSGVMKFLVKASSPPPGRPMEYVFACTITLTADRKATLAMSENLNK